MVPEKELESQPGYTYTARATAQLGEAISSCTRRNSFVREHFAWGQLSKITAVYSLAEMAYIH